MNVDQIRFTIFLTVFILMLILESVIPRHPTVDSKPRRLAVNLSLTGIDIVLVKLIMGTAAVGTAQFAVERGWGLLNLVDFPVALEMFLAVVFLDLMIYLQHVVIHMVPFFWRFHAVHHSDLDLDVSSGLRFHPVEILGSLLFKMGVILALGPTVMTVIVFEAILNGMAQFSHSNIKLPLPLDRVLRVLIVTPDMHRIHHSEEVSETNSNFGFNLSIWDRLLETYNQDAKKPQAEIVIGLSIHKEPKDLTLAKILLMPLHKTPNL